MMPRTTTKYSHNVALALTVHLISVIDNDSVEAI
jgi:hypothetical protein